MKKFLILIYCFLLTTLTVYANDSQDALQFFDDFIKSSNAYDLENLKMYKNNAVIKRRVLKKEPILVIVPFEEHIKIWENMAKHKAIAIKFQNSYIDKKVEALGNNRYKITARRCPNVMKETFDSYVIIEKQNNNFKVIEEYSDVKNTYFLKYKDKK